MKSSKFGWIAFAVMATSIGYSVAGQETEEGRGFGSFVELMNVPLAVVDVADDRRAATFLMRNAQVFVDRKGTSVQTLCLPFRLQLKPGEESEQATVSIRGYSNADAGTTAAATLYCFGKTLPIELKNDDDYEGTFSGKIVADQDEIVGTVCLVVQKTENDDVGALLTVDSIDVWMGDAGPKKTEPKKSAPKREAAPASKE